MDFALTLNVISTVATVIGVFAAIISIWQAGSSQNAAKKSELQAKTSQKSAEEAILQAENSRKAAEKAEQARNQLINQLKTSELTELQAVLRKAQKSMEKFGPSCTVESIRGITTSKEAQDVQEFIVLLKENRMYFESDFENAADKFFETLVETLDKFSKSQNDLNKSRRYGQQLFLQLSNISPIIKRLVDIKLEKIHQ